MRRAIVASLLSVFVVGCASTSPTAIIDGRGCLTHSKSTDCARAAPECPVAPAVAPDQASPPRRLCRARCDTPRPLPNLLLGQSPDQVWLAQQFTYRSDWPSVATGYRFDDMTYFTDIQFDDQSFYDRMGGAFYSSGQQVRTGVMLR